MATPALRLPSGRLAAGVGADAVSKHKVGRRAREQLHAIGLVGRDHVAGEGIRSANLVADGERGQENPVLTIAQRKSSGVVVPIRLPSTKLF